MIKDDPLLDCRIKGLERNSPVKVIIANKINFNSDYKLFQNDTKTIIVYSDTDQNREDITKFQENNIHFLAAPAHNNLIDLNYCLKELNRMSINSILVEGGSIISTILLQQGLIDEINWFKSSKIIGSDGKNAINEMDFTNMKDVISDFSLKDVTQIDDEDCLMVYRKKS